MAETKYISVDELHVDPMNVRPEPNINPEFVGSIRDEGVLEPLVVRPHDGEYGVFIGSRRLAAAREAGLDEIPCTVAEGLDDERAEVLSYVENEHRLNLPNWKVRELVADRYEDTDGRKTRGKRVSEVAGRLNLGRKTVYKYLSIGENFHPTLIIRLKKPPERSKSEREQLATVLGEKLCAARNGAEGLDLEKERARGFPSLVKIPAEVAEKLSKSDFFTELQEKDLARAHRLATEAAKLGREKADEAIQEYEREVERSEQEGGTPPASGPEKLTVLVGVRTAKALDEWAEGKEGIDTRAQAVARILRKSFAEMDYYGDPDRAEGSD